MTTNKDLLPCREAFEKWYNSDWKTNDRFARCMEESEALRIWQAAWNTRAASQPEVTVDELNNWWLYCTHAAPAEDLMKNYPNGVKITKEFKMTHPTQSEIEEAVECAKDVMRWETNTKFTRTQFDAAINTLIQAAEMVQGLQRDLLLQKAAVNKYYSEREQLRQQVKTMREALDMISGKRQCPDNLMGNVDIAKQALAAVDQLEAGQEFMKQNRDTFKELADGEKETK